MPFGVSGIAGGAAIVFFAYIGFDAVATSAEECKNPARDLPIGIIGSLVVCTALYVIVAAVLTGVVPYTELNNPEPVAFALRYIGYNLGSALVGVGAIAGITTVLLVLLYGQARIFFAMSRDGMVPARVCKIHKRYHTPYIVTVLGADIHRSFHCPLVWLIAPLAVVACGYLMYHLPFDTWIRFIVWCAFGCLVYFGYSYQHSTLAKKNQARGKSRRFRKLRQTK